LDRAHRFAGTAVDAFIGVDVETAFALVDAIDRAFVDAGLVLEINTRLGSDVRHWADSSNDPRMVRRHLPQYALPRLPRPRAPRHPVLRMAAALRRRTWHGRRPRCLRLGGHTFSGGRREVDELQAGRRVVVRYSLDPGDTHSTSDALGLVTAVHEAGVEIDTKRGPLRIPRSQILLVHEVPP